MQPNLDMEIWKET